MLGDIGAPELLIVLAIVILLFGGSKVAQLGSSLGSAVREFRHELSSDDDDNGQQLNTNTEAAAQANQSPPALPGDEATTAGTSVGPPAFRH